MKLRIKSVDMDGYLGRDYHPARTDGPRGRSRRVKPMAGSENSRPKFLEPKPMDPNANLRMQENLLADLNLPYVPASVRRTYRQELNALRAHLRTWLNGGGFEPDWSACPMAAKFFGRTEK
jgi:hypothetical protein